MPHAPLPHTADTGIEATALHFCRFTVTSGDSHSVRVRAMGVPMRNVEFSGPAIKAVTYHQLEVAESAHHWYGRVYFDV